MKRVTRTKRAGSNSIYFGVYKVEGKGRNKGKHWWRARIMIEGKTLDLGRFDNDIDAAIAYNSYVHNNKLKTHPMNVTPDHSLWAIRCENEYYMRLSGQELYKIAKERKKQITTNEEIKPNEEKGI